MALKIVSILFILLFINVCQANAQSTKTSEALNAYSFDLYSQAKVKDQNLFLSPLSTYHSLLILSKGAKNKTKQEFEKVLYLNKTDSTGNKLLFNPENQSKGYSNFTFSNAIWLDKAFQVKTEFREIINNQHLSLFKRTDFKNKSQAISEINDWVCDNTNQLIHEIIDENNINNSTQLLISNAVYFKGEWLHKFDKEKTCLETFFANFENQYTVNFMKKTETLDYYENDEFQFISKPYRSSNLSFCILLPKKLFDIELIEQNLSNTFFNTILNHTHSAKTALSIPQLKIESSMYLKEALENTGLTTAFSPLADFSGITDKHQLMLGNVIHKSHIELDEEKTEAAAATSTSIRITGRASYKIFTADHPFVFFIIDKKSKAIVFMGRYVKPTVGEKITDTKNISENLKQRANAKTEVGNTAPLIYLVNKRIISQAEFQAIDIKNIDSLRIYKSQEKISTFTSENCGGIIEITLKKE